MILGDAVGEAGDLVFLEYLAVSRVLVRRVLLHVAERMRGVIASAVGAVAHKLSPSGIEFRMGVQAHTCAHFHDERVVFVECHEVADKTPKERDVLAAGKIQVEAAKGLVGPVSDIHGCNLKLILRAAQQLAQRLKSVESASVIAPSDENEVFLNMQQIAFIRLNLFVRVKIQAGAALADERVFEAAHDHTWSARPDRCGWRNPRMTIKAVAEFMHKAMSEE